MALLRVEHISHSYGTTPVLNRVSLALHAGEFGCLLGSSGSGKSTLLRIIAGLEAPREGSVMLAETVLNNTTTFVKPEKRNIGMVFQDYALFPHLTVAQNIRFGITAKSDAAMIEKLVSILGLGDLLKRYPHQLSGGQQQRVAIARSMAVNPALLLMDEPFSNLDEWMKEDVRDELKTILRQLNATVLFVTHHAMDALSFADRIMVMDKGHIVQQGTAQQIIDEPINANIAGIFGKVNLFTHHELKMYFDIDKPAGTYFVKPEHFEMADNGLPFTVSHSVYHGTYYDTNLVNDQRLVHIHLPGAHEVKSSIRFKPVAGKIYSHQP